MNDWLGQLLNVVALAALALSRGSTTLYEPPLDFLLACQLLATSRAVLDRYRRFKMQEAVMTLILSKRVIFVLATAHVLRS